MLICQSRSDGQARWLGIVTDYHSRHRLLGQATRETDAFGRRCQRLRAVQPRGLGSVLKGMVAPTMRRFSLRLPNPRTLMRTK